jgi:hypothetical protein
MWRSAETFASPIRNPQLDVRVHEGRKGLMKEDAPAQKWNCSSFSPPACQLHGSYLPAFQLRIRWTWPHSPLL